MFTENHMLLVCVRKFHVIPHDAGQQELPLAVFLCDLKAHVIVNVHLRQSSVYEIA